VLDPAVVQLGLEAHLRLGPAGQRHRHPAPGLPGALRRRAEHQVRAVSTGCEPGTRGGRVGMPTLRQWPVAVGHAGRPFRLGLLLTLWFWSNRRRTVVARPNVDTADRVVDEKRRVEYQPRDTDY